MISYKETIERLKYIADSPPREHGGFHEEAIKTAKAALYHLKKKADGGYAMLGDLNGRLKRGDS